MVTSIRPWKRGTAAARAANSAVPAGGEVGVETDTGNLVVADGTTNWSSLKRLVRLDEVTTAVQQYVTSVVVTNSSLTAIANESGYQWVLVDSTGRVAFGVKPDGTTVANKLSLGAGTVALTALAQSVQDTLLKTIPAEAGYVWAIADTAGRMALYVAADGTVTIPKASLGAGSVTATMLSASLQAAIPASVVTESGWSYTITDSASRVTFGVRNDGRVAGKDILPPPAAVNSNYIIDAYRDSAGNRQLRSTNRTTGTSIALTSGSGVANVAPTLTSDDIVIYRSQTGLAEFESWAVPAAGGSPYPMRSRFSPVYAIGDSLTAGTGATNNQSSMPGHLGQILGTQVVGDGSGGQTSIQIAARQGGAPAKVTFTSDTIAATTSAQTVTVDIDLLNGSAGSYSRTGTIGGVHGTLTGGATTSAYTFTRDTAGSAVVLTGATDFVPDTLPTYQSQILVAGIGRNNFTAGGAAATIVANGQAMVAALKAVHKRYVFWSIPPSVGEETGTGTRTTLDSVNAAMQAAFPNNWVDAAAYLRTDDAFTVVATRYPGVTKTAQDTTDIANGITPSTFRSDSIHLNDYGYYALAWSIYQFINSKGWLI